MNKGSYSFDRNLRIDAIRGIAILIVVYAHALQSCNAMDPTNPVHLIIQTFQMPLLMGISGYCSNYGEPPRSIKHSIIKRMQRLLLPYLIWEQVYYFLSLYFNGGVYSLHSQIYSILISGFWFLRILFAIYCIYYLYWFLKKTLSGYVKVIWIPQILACITCSGCAFFLSKVPGFSSILKYLLCFGIGNILYKVFDKDDGNKKKAFYIVMSLLFIGSVPVFLGTNNEGPIRSLMDKSMALSGSVFTIAMSLMMYRFFCARIVNALVYIGRHTLSIYAIHWCILFGLNIIDYNSLFVNNGINIYVASVIVWIIWLSICLGSLKAIELFKKQYDLHLNGRINIS